MLTLLDRYIIKKFLSTFFFILGLIIIVAIVIDLSEKLDDFIQNQASTKALIFDYYIYFVPWFYNLFNNLFVFIAVVFFTSKMAANSEVVAMLASGVSYRRVLRPYIIASVLLALLSWFMNSWIIPWSNAQKVAFENEYINGRKDAEAQWQQDVHRQLKPGKYMYIDNFRKTDSIGYKVTIEEFEGRDLVYKLSAERLSWNDSASSWHVENYVERYLGTDSALMRGKQKDIAISFNPQEFFLRKDDVGIFNNSELDRVIEAERMRGAEQIEYYLVERYRRLAMPFSTIILTVIGVTLSSRKTRGGIGVSMAIGFGLAFSYIFLNQMTYTLAYSGEMNSLLAVWIPNFIYAIIALVLVKVAPK